MAAKVLGRISLPQEMTISASQFVAMVKKNNAAPTRAGYDHILSVFQALPDYIKDRLPTMFVYAVKEEELGLVAKFDDHPEIIMTTNKVNDLKKRLAEEIDSTEVLIKEVF